MGLMSTTLDGVTLPVLSVKARPVRRVRTPEGARYYGLPMQAIIKPNAKPVADVPLPAAAVTRQEFLSAWHDDLARLAVGRNLGKAADRTAFRADVIDRLAALDDDNLDALLEDLDGVATNDKRRSVADAYITAAHDAEAEAGEQYDLFGSIEDDTVPLIPADQPEHATQAVEDVTKSTRGEADPTPEPEDMDVVSSPTEFDIPSWRLEQVDAMIAKANRRAERAGIPERFSYETVGTRTESVQKRDELGEPLGLPEQVEWSLIRLNTPAVKHDGYTFVATLAWDEEAGLIARVAPGQNLGKHAPEARECNVCNSKRDRKDTFVVRKDDTGEVTQVGRNCLQQFMGITPGNLWMLTYAEDFAKELRDDDDDDEGGGGGERGPERRYGSRDVMALAWAVVKDRGWVSRKTADAYSEAGGGKQTTADAVRDAMDPPTGKGGDDVRRWSREMLAEAVNYEAEAQSVIDMAAAFDGDSDYETNLRALAGAKTVSDRNLNLWVSAIAGKIKRDEQAAERVAREKAMGASRHFGAVGDKIGKAKGAAHPPMTAQVTAVRVSEGNYGPSTLVAMVNADGNVLKWWATGNLSDEYAVGDPVLITGGAIKGHGEFQGVPETNLTRVKMEVTSDVADNKRQAEEERRVEALRQGEQGGPGLTVISEVTEDAGERWRLEYERNSRLKVGSRVRAFDEYVQIKRGRSTDSIKTYRTVTITSLAEPEKGYGGAVNPSRSFRGVDDNGEEMGGHTNTVEAHDESTLLPKAGPQGDVVPAGMRAFTFTPDGEQSEPIGPGTVVRWLDRGSLDDDGVFRRHYVEGVVTQVQSDGDVRGYAHPGGGRDGGESFEYADVVAVGGALQALPETDYSGLDMDALLALGRERGLESYDMPSEYDLNDPDRAERSRTRLADRLRSYDRLAFVRALREAYNARAVAPADDGPQASGGGGRGTRIGDAVIRPVRIGRSISHYEVTIDGTDYIISSGAQQSWGGQIGWGVREASRDGFTGWNGIYRSYREAAASLA